MTTSTPPPKHAQLRLAEIRKDISSRLWSINRGMSSGVFNDLMDQMALLQYEFEQRGGSEFRTKGNVLPPATPEQH